MSPKLAYRSTLPRPDDPEILDTVDQALRLGVPLRYAAALAGISETTAYHWVTDCARAMEAAPPGTPLEELGSAALFGQTVKEARASLVLEAVTEWRAAGKDWPKWATLLERLFPQDFGRGPRSETSASATNNHVLGRGAEADRALLAILHAKLLTVPGSPGREGGGAVSEDPPGPLA